MCPPTSTGALFESMYPFVNLKHTRQTRNTQNQQARRAVDMSTRVRLTKRQHLLICKKRSECPEWTYNELAECARVTFCLTKCPEKSTILDIVKHEAKLSTLSADCLSKQRLRSHHMVRLDEAVAEFVIEAELSKTPISGREVIRVGAGLTNELQTPRCCRPRFTRAGWLRHFLACHNFRHKRAHGKIGSVNVEEALKYVAQLRERIGHFHPQDVQ